MGRSAIECIRPGTENTTCYAATLETFVVRSINLLERSSKIRLPNNDYSLFPNQFVNVKLLVDTMRDTLLVPAAAVQKNPQGTFVYVVKPDNTVGRAHGDGRRHPREM